MTLAFTEGHKGAIELKLLLSFIVTLSIDHMVFGHVAWISLTPVLFFMITIRGSKSVFDADEKHMG